MVNDGRSELLLLLLLVCRLTVGPVLAQVRHPLPVLWMMPVSSGQGGVNLTAGLGAAVTLALQDLKKQPPPLGNYDLQLQLLDSQCDPAKSLKALFDAMWAGPKYLMVFGGVCPGVTSLIARSLPALNLVQVSFAAASPSLANRKWYGNLFSTMPSDRAVNQATVKLLQRHHWTRVGIVTQETTRLSQMKKDLMRQLLKVEVQPVSTETVSEDVCSSLKRLKDLDVRIIIAQFEEDSVSEVFCCAYRLNLFGSRYQWMVVDGGTGGWRLGGHVSGCTTTSVLTAADGSIRLQIRPLSDTNTPGVSGRTAQNYQDAYLQQLIQEGAPLSALHAFAYDTVWVAASALAQVMEAVKHREKYSAKRNVTVSEDEVQKMLLEAVKKTQFEGVTGPVFFRNGERPTSIELIQFQGSSGVLVGEFSSETQQLRLRNHLLKFKGGGPARDQTLVRPQRRHVKLLQYSIVSSAAAVTIIIALMLLCFIIFHRKHWLLRSGSVSQDQLLLLGVLLSSSSVLVSGVDGASVSDGTFEILCSAGVWTLCVGHTVSFTVLLIRTWTLYSLCTVKLKQRSRSSRLLLWMLLMDVLVLTSWQILDPLRRVVLQHHVETDPSDQDVLVQPFSEHCGCSHMELWLTAVYGYRGPLLGLGCFLAWNIRSVQTDHPAVSGQRLALSMFAVTVFSGSGVLGSLLTSHNPPLQFCLSSVLILCCNICILIGLFGPTILHVRLNSSKLQPPCELQVEAAEEEDEEQLSRLNRQLKSRTSQLDAEIETITMQLSSESEILHHVPRSDHAELRSVSWNNEARADDRNPEKKLSSPEDVNAPELVQRRLSVQLPILHHSYLPVIGGVPSSSSSLFGSREAFVHHDAIVTTITSCPPGGHVTAEPIRRQQ
ncbi:gamma-aminobutyric acid type B receptor subunit 2-like [Hippoglossus hippoglossus]|uniref:gamma-aminobutyric acid type B receptor subunit 2-like n=1 Tax=Hippoglossus hippoglossus TaxID=8267 RepID=UPI00148BBB1C|nr:gamma-aminobutyric acid type B receptor subunit 2-like [Hippoglossus hippoglossus]